MANDVEAEIDALRAEIAKFILEAIQTDTNGVVEETFRNALAAALPPLLARQLPSDVQNGLSRVTMRLQALEDGIAQLRRENADLRAAVHHLDGDVERFTRELGTVTNSQINLRLSSRAQSRDFPFRHDEARGNFQRRAWLRRQWPWLAISILATFVVVAFQFVSEERHRSSIPGLRSEPGSSPSPDTASANTDLPSDKNIEPNWRAVIQRAATLPPTESADVLKVLCGDHADYRADPNACPTFAARRDEIALDVSNLRKAMKFTVDAIGVGECPTSIQNDPVPELVDVWTCLLERPRNE